MPARDVTMFAQALVSGGFTPEEAEHAADILVSGETFRRPAYPCAMSMVLSRRHCRMTADIDAHGSLVLVTGAPPLALRP